jgi:hypothetical protein
MNKIYFSKRAKNEIIRSLQLRKLHSGKQLVAKLLYFTRCFSHAKTGEIIEHGDGIVLSFVETAEPYIGEYKSVQLDPITSVLVGPLSALEGRNLFILWSGKKFVACFSHLKGTLTFDRTVIP